MRILTGIWITFAILNLFIPILSITRGKMVSKGLAKVGEASSQRLHRASILVMILYNVLYTTVTIIMHIKGHPTVLECHLRNLVDKCRIPQTAISYAYVLGILNTKAVILPVALLVELIAAVWFALVTYTESSATVTDTIQKLTMLIKMIVIWQVLVFVQITVGLVGIPLAVLLFISPARVLLLCGGTIFLFILVIFILASIPFPNSCKCRPRHMMKSLLFMLETLFIAGLFIFASLTYYSIVKSGMNMDGVKGYTLSLIPTILISVSVWIIKIKYLKEVKKRGSLRKPKIKRENSLLTDEEMISLSTTE